MKLHKRIGKYWNDSSRVRVTRDEFGNKYLIFRINGRLYGIW